MKKNIKTTTLKQFEKETGVRFCTDHSDKMENMISLSTSPLVNPFCQARHKNGEATCNVCYSLHQFAFRKNMQDKYKENAKNLSKGILNVLPRLNALDVRFEAFGDLLNITHAINYILIAQANPRTQFAIWTKNINFLQRAIDKYGKPKNLVVVYSSMRINEPENHIKEKFSCVDKVFTVYSKEYAEAHNVKINCGGNKCFDCLRCYSKRTASEVNEMVKSDQRKGKAKA